MKIFVKVKTRARAQKIERVDDKNFMVQVKALPCEGKANEEVIATLARYFGMAQTNIQLIRGRKSKHKIFKIV